MAVKPAEEVKKQVQASPTLVRDLAHIAARDQPAPAPIDITVTPPVVATTTRPASVYKPNEKLYSALKVAEAILNSPRHQTLNPTFAKQCVEFVEALEVASGQRFDPD
jgi:hypothetical protein